MVLAFDLGKILKFAEWKFSYYSEPFGLVYFCQLCTLALWHLFRLIASD